MPSAKYHVVRWIAAILLAAPGLVAVAAFGAHSVGSVTAVAAGGADGPPPLLAFVAEADSGNAPHTLITVPPTATVGPATAVPPTPSPTATAVPPTPTVVPVTATAVPPTATAVPLTATAVPAAPTATAIAATTPTFAPRAARLTAAVAPAAAAGGPPQIVDRIPASAWHWMDAQGWTLEWRQGPGPARVAEAEFATSTIVIWHDSRRSDSFWLGAFGHELGHAVAYQHFTSEQENDWNAMRGLSSWPWVPGTLNDFNVGQGDFAESFMSYLFGHPIRSVGGPLTEPQRQWIAANTPF